MRPIRKPSALSSTLALFTPVATLAISTTDAGAAGYLKIPDIDGESTSKSHEKWIELDSVSFGVERPADVSSTGIRSIGPAKSLTFSVTKQLDKSSPQLFLGCALGTRHDEVKLELTRPSGIGTEIVYYKITLTNVLVTSVQSGGSTDGPPNENITLNYEKIEVTYNTVDPKTGTSTGTSSAAWDLTGNTKS